MPICFVLNSFCGVLDNLSVIFYTTLQFRCVILCDEYDAPVMHHSIWRVDCFYATHAYTDNNSRKLNSTKMKLKRMPRMPQLQSKCVQTMPISSCQKTTRTRTMKSTICHKTSTNVYSTKRKLFSCGCRKDMLN